MILHPEIKRVAMNRYTAVLKWTNKHIGIISIWGRRKYKNAHMLLASIKVTNISYNVITL